MSNNIFLSTIWLTCLAVMAQGATLMMNMPQISKMEVQCSKNGMSVNIEFDQPFDGIIFSKGHFADPACRYVGAGSKSATHSFVVPMESCGTTKVGGGGVSVLSNTVVIQNDAVVQEIWDTAQKFSCKWTDKVTKTVSVRPLTIDMLEAGETKFATADDDVVDVWMDLQKGRWPDSSAIGSAVRIGEQLSLIVGVSDVDGQMDLQVRDCYAHSTADVTDPSAFRVQLTDTSGCVKKSKLLSPFKRDRPTATSVYKGSTVKYSLVSAFSFPDNMQVFTSCNVEVCKGGCEPNPCQPDGLEDSPSTSTVLPVPETTVKIVTTPPPVRTTVAPPPPPTITLPSLDYLPPLPAARSVTTPAPKPPSTSTKQPTVTAQQPTVAREQSPVTTAKPSASCVFGSKDPRCVGEAKMTAATAPIVTPPTTTLEPPPPPAPKCYPGSDLPECAKQPTKEISTEEPVLCPLGSTDPSCNLAGGSDDSPVTVNPALSTDVPTESEVTTTIPKETPREGKNKGGESEWKGDPATHAFHMFHFQRGDGRRGRKVAINKSKRSVDNEEDGVASEFAQVRLTHSVRIIPAEEGAAPYTKFDPETTSILLNEESRSTSIGGGNVICLSNQLLSVSACLILSSLVGLMAIVVILSARYVNARKQLDKLVLAQQRY